MHFGATRTICCGPGKAPKGIPNSVLLVVWANTNEKIRGKVRSRTHITLPSKFDAVLIDANIALGSHGTFTQIQFCAAPRLFDSRFVRILQREPTSQKVIKSFRSKNKRQNCPTFETQFVGQVWVAHVAWQQLASVTVVEYDCLSLAMKSIGHGSEEHVALRAWGAGPASVGGEMSGMGLSYLPLMLSDAAL